MATPQHTDSEENGQGVEISAKRRIVAFRCPVQLKKMLQMRAIERDTSVEAICVEALELYFGLKERAA